MKQRLVILFALFSFAGAAQVNDFGIWTSGSVEYDFLNRFSAKLSEELRFNENATELGSFFTDAGLGYRLPVEGLRVGLSYRYIRRRGLNDLYSGRNRWYLDIAYKKKVSVITASWRMRFQTQQVSGLTDEDQPTAANYWRNKFSFRYNAAARIKPYVYTELFTSLNTGYTDNLRLGAGIEFKKNEIHHFDLSYFYQREYNVRNPGRDFIIALEYALDLNALLEAAGSKRNADSTPR